MTENPSDRPGDKPPIFAPPQGGAGSPQEPLYVVEEERLPTLEKVKDIATIAQAVATVLAILVAGLWFFLQGEASFKANISHAITHRFLDPDRAWVCVSVNITNTGKRALAINRGIVRIQQILPMDQCIEQCLQQGQPLIKPGEVRVDWPKLADSYDQPLNLYLEAGESDHLNFEFIVPAYARTVKIYSYFEKQKEPPIGWAESSIYDLKARREGE